MSLESPNFIERLGDWPYWKITAIGVGLLVLIGFVAFAVDRCGTWSDNRSDRKTKEQIANTAKEIANISNTISNLELQKAEKQGELRRDMEQLQTDLKDREDAKAETNAALANFQKAVSSNSNVNRTAEDLEEVLRRLGQ
jgi:hypothetical protein